MKGRSFREKETLPYHKKNYQAVQGKEAMCSLEKSAGSISCRRLKGKDTGGSIFYRPGKKRPQQAANRPWFRNRGREKENKTADLRTEPPKARKYHGTNPHEKSCKLGLDGRRKGKKR